MKIIHPIARQLAITQEKLAKVEAEKNMLKTENTKLRAQLHQYRGSIPKKRQKEIQTTPRSPSKTTRSTCVPEETVAIAADKQHSFANPTKN